MTLAAKQRSSLLEDLAATFPDLTFDRNAFDIFLEVKDHGAWEGKSAADWLRSVNLRHKIVEDSEGNFCSDKLDRNALIRYCDKGNNASDIESFVAVMAWGAMNVRNGRLALRSPGTVLRLVHQIRCSTSDRALDYERFYKARQDGSLEGIGPAYYTKLLFFLRQDQTSYILDQWMAKSIHVLTGSCKFPQVVRLEGNQARVSDAVGPNDYQKYCGILDVIAKHMECAGSAIEERIFSEGGREPKRWRKHVKEHWPKLL